MIDWALAGQTLVTIVLGIFAALFIVGAAVMLFTRLAERYALDENGEQWADLGTPAGAGAKPWNPDDCDDDEIVDMEDSEHMRVVREHEEQHREQHSPIPSSGA